MKSRLLFALFASVSLAGTLATSFAFIACSSSSTQNGAEPDASYENPDTGSNNQPDSDNILDGNGSDSTDASNDLDVATGDGAYNAVDAADIPDGGAAVTPGEINCNGDASSCAVPANECCALVDGGGSCVTSGTACPTGSASYACDEKADCTNGALCCGTASASGIGTTCSTLGCGFFPQFCRTNGECTNGQPCTVQKCTYMGGTAQTFELCGLFTSGGLAGITCTAN